MPGIQPHRNPLSSYDITFPKAGATRSPLYFEQ
jgi:hypothetical protein